MAPQVKKAKTAFMFYQADQLAKIRAELGGPAGCSMGEAMTELAARWRNLSDAARAPYMAMERDDRTRFHKESHQADIAAMAEQEERRKKLGLLTDPEELLAQGTESTSRGARQKVQAERETKLAMREQRKLAREENMDGNEAEERRMEKERLRQETEERRKKRKQEEQALAKQHTKLDKEQSKKAAQRLEYLLKQSSIFSRLQGALGGASSKGVNGAAHACLPGSKEDMANKKEEQAAVDDEAADDGGGKKRAATSGKVPGVHHIHAKDSPVESNSEDENEEEHVFLTQQPSCIKFGKLKAYQLEALNWMIHLSEKGLNGILADEMGLGKTLQSISILAYHYEFRGIQGPHLICVPKSTLSNWMNELKRWCPSLRAIKFHGSREEREWTIDNYLTNEAAAHDGRRPEKQMLDVDGQTLIDDNSDNPRQWDVCVTTYEVANNEKRTLQKFAWKYLVIDEAHRLKNDASMFSATVRSFRTANRLLLTGTPLQNNLHELWALLNFLLPDIFSSSEQFDDWFNLEIDDEEAKKNMISQLHKILTPFLLRRLKVDVAKGLPPKTETILMVGMSKMQKQLYKKLLLRDLDSVTGNTTSKNRTVVLNIVMQLRKCCGHPYLFEGVEDRSLDPLGEHLVENCGKLSMVDKLLKRLFEKGHRVLIFTQMTRVLDIMEDFMVMRGYKYCRIDGNTTFEDRESSIDEFNRPGSEKFCFILSTRAGGLGINLQTADVCILYDSDWNPQQVNLQAQDRCHRLGQKRPVQVFRLVCENTIEEKIVERAQQKLKLDAMVVQQGRLKDQDKVTKEEIMAAVRFGADTVFRSEESTITDDDIDVILARGAAKTKELAEKIQKRDKGNLLDFRLDAGISAQTFEGVDYSDKELRDHLRMLAANTVGKRERRPPPTSYNPIIHTKKSMVVNNRRIKLPKCLRIPQMEDHQFYNRERLLDLGKLEFETYAALREAGQLPSKEVMERQRTLLEGELGQEKLELVAEGFGDWSRSQYYHFVKACAKYGRNDIAAIANDMDKSEEDIASYSKAFWEYGPSELKKEWERVAGAVERGEKKIEKQKKLAALLSQFVSKFDNPRTEMVFANKGTAHFALEQDRALLCAVETHGYGNWDLVREAIRTDSRLKFQHSAQSMSAQTIAKRCDYRMRQMEKELEAREKAMKNKRPVAVVAAYNAIEAIKEADLWDAKARDAQLAGQEPSSLKTVSTEARQVLEERLRDRDSTITRLREIEVQNQRALKMADETRQAIYDSAQYVNYSNIALKPANVPAGGKDDGYAKALKEGIDIEARINREVLSVPACRQCESCNTSNTKLCQLRLEVRNRLLAKEAKPPEVKVVPEKKKPKKRKIVDVPPSTAKKAPPPPATPTPKAVSSGPKKKKHLLMQKPDGQLKVRVTSQGNKRMTIPDDLFPEFCRRISAAGTGERMALINQFVDENPTISARQVTMRLSEITTRERPACVPPGEKKKGPRFMFYLRPAFYKLLPEDERPENWEVYAAADEQLYGEEQGKRAAAAAAAENEADSPTPRVSNSETASMVDGEGDETEDDGDDIDDDDDEEEEDDDDYAVDGGGEPDAKRQRVDEE